MFQNMRYAPFLKLYKNLLDSIPDVEYDVIYFDRDRSLNERKDKKYIAIPWKGKGTLSAPGYERIVNFILYSIQVKKILKEKKYDYIIVLTTFPAVLLSGFLIKNYKNKFLIDIRDYTHEQFKPYFFIEKKVLSSAQIRVISSPGFEHFLPNGDYLTCHNIDESAFQKNNYDFSMRENGRIIISYVGTISYKNLCKKLIQLVISDDRFEFHFYGNEADGLEIENYVSELDNERIRIFGPFKPEEKQKIYQNSDLIFNCYGNDNMLVKYAISNKYYDGAFYRKPLLVSPNTAMDEFSKGFAYPLDLDHISNLNELYAWYYSIDKNKFIDYGNTVINKAIEENAEFKSEIKKKIRELK